MAFTFTDQPKQAERKRRAQERRKAERDRLRRERAERARQQREREEAYWRRSYSSNGGGFATRSGIAAQDKDMALEMINAGYRTLSRKHHPDAGGSHEKMVEVNRALEALRKIIGGQS